MESSSLCMLCHRSDITLYEINSNEIIVGSEVVSFHDLIFEIFLRKLHENSIRSICEVCKNQMINFYVFKNKIKHNFAMPKLFSYLKEFLNTNQAEPSIKITNSEFVVSFNNVVEEPQASIDQEIFADEPIEEVYQSDEDDFMAVEEVEACSGFDMESVLQGESDSNFTDQEYEVEDRSPDQPKIEIDDTEFSECVTKTYMCECGAQKSSAQELQKHMNNHKRKSGKSKLSCNEPSCNVDFKDQKFLEIHEKAHENFKAIAPHLATYVCYKCQRMFASEDDYETHLSQFQLDDETHTQYPVERRSAYDDHMLKRIVSTQENLEDNEEVILCGYCPKKAHNLDMKVHLLFFHTQIVFCPFDNRCFEGFKKVRLFSEHIRNKHPELFEKSDLYNCRHCNSSFESHFEKLAHMKQCGAKLYACSNHCDKRFATEWLLKIHLRQIQGHGRFVCDTCSKVCVSKSDLQIHNRSHTNERPYSCPICLKSFKTSANRASHMDIHESEKRHPCDVCGEKFQTRPILRKHKKKHDEKYMAECVCKICHRQYITKPHMLRHVKDYHGAPAELKTSGLNEYFAEHLQE